MSTESNKALVRQFYTLFDQGDIDGVVALAADNYVDHTHPPGAPSGREGLRAGSQRLMTAFPQVHTTVDLLVAEGDLVTAVHTHEGVHSGPYGPIPATGKPIHINGIEVFRIVDGKIAEFWRRDDDLGAFQQLGLIPALGG